MIDIAIYRYIKDVIGITTPFVYGSGEGLTAPYIRMFKVTDEERPEVLCEKQGDSGRALFQFNLYTGGTVGAGSNAAQAIQDLEVLKKQVALIKGNIGITPLDYNIWNNITTGVRNIADGSQTLQTWGSLFESTIWWKKL